MYIEFYLSFGTFILLLLVDLILGIIFGNITQSINERKGYSGGFWTGFIFGLVGVAIVIHKLDLTPQKTLGEDKGMNERLIASGGWKCSKCSTVNASYVTTCHCGVSKTDNDRISAE